MIEKTKEKLITSFTYYIILVLFTGIVGYLSLGRGFNFDLYAVFGKDGTFGMTLVKSIQENGLLGIWLNSRIGAPETATLIDYPAIGNIMVLILWVISWFTTSTPRIMYIYLILTFILDGVSMSLLLRKIKINKETAFVISSLFAFAPYHFYRYLGHSSLINYMYVPIAIYLALNILGVINNEKKWKIVICAILLGLGYGYYYAFGLILLAVAYLVRFIRLEKKRKIVEQLWISVTVLTTVFLSLMPKIIYTILNGSNTEVGHRAFFEQEVYGLKIINLLLPVSYSRIEALRNITASYTTSGAPLVNENAHASLGFIGSIGFILLCLALIVSLTKKTKCEGKEWELIDFLSLTTLVLVLMGAIGGFGEIFNWAITSQIRCYNRSSIYIMGLSLIMIAILMNKVECKKKSLSIILCIIILGVGCFDQIKIYPANWQESGIKPSQEMYKSFFTEVENSLDNGAMVYQLPYMDFPEAGAINGISDYKHFVAYLFTNDLRWSYGAVRGRNLVAKELNVDDGMTYKFLIGIRKAGFQAVYIDLDGYVDGGKQIMEFYNGLGITPMVSGDGKLYVYDISKSELSESLLEPGYSFVHNLTNKYNVAVSNDEQYKVTKGLQNMDTTAYATLYSWAASDIVIIDGTDEEYVDYLYNTLLKRGESDDERASWVGTIQNGASREDVFYTFLNSEEFRNGIGLIDGN
jgi:phosphoglycerol transferase